LGLAAALGASNAEDYLREYLNPNFYRSEYLAEYAVIKEEFNAMDEENWRSNMHYGWLWAIKAMFNKPDTGMPSFMRNNAWYDKQLATALASRTEQRNGSSSNEGLSSTEAETTSEEIPMGYVEPNPDLFKRLHWLADFSSRSFRMWGQLSEYRDELFTDFMDLLNKLIEISKKELKNEVLSDIDYSFIWDFGETVESLFCEAK
jgi:hypothetical protein